METATADVVIVGGGIGGSSLAIQLARAGMAVVVLEKTTTFPDRVRGETWSPWGVGIAQQLGLVEPLLAAGGIFTTKFAFYDPAIPPEASVEMAIDLSQILPGVPGNLNVGHPAACAALVDEAVRAGAVVHRGVADVRLELTGSTPVVRYRGEGGQGGERSVGAGLVVGADGRASHVRRQAGIELHKAPMRHWMSGLLVASDRDLHCEVDSYGAGTDVNWFSFPQGRRHSRIYLAHLDAAGHRFAGPGGTARFLEALAQVANPEIAALAPGTPIGPIATHPSIDTWTGQPCAPGVVLMGDAAGYNDPIIGQGLALTMADTRDLAAVILGGGRTVADFGPYSLARADRFAKQRLAATIMADLLCSFGADDGPRRLRALPLIGTDERAQAFGAALLAGPEALPPGTDAIQRARETLLAA